AGTTSAGAVSGGPASGDTPSGEPAAGGPATTTVRTADATRSATPPMTSTAPRQSQLRASAATTGTPSTVPRVAPPSTTATARPYRCSGTMAAECAFTVAHSRPVTAAPSSRPASATA